MSTRAELRSSLRMRLEDTGATAPLWTDADLNDFIGQSMRRYGRWAPLTALVTAVAATDVVQVAIPAGVPEWGIVRVRDATGADISAMNNQTGDGPARMQFHAQAFRVWGGQLILQRKVYASEAGNWTIDYLDERPMPTSDVGEVSIEAGDEPVVIELALAQAYERRLAEDYKRGSRNIAPDLARETRESARTMFVQTRRRAKGGWLSVG